jgi:ribosome assembly protein 4
LPVPDKKTSETNTTAFPTNIYKTLITPGLISTEEVQNISAAPQAVFRFQAVSRCASTIPGHGEAILAIQFSPRSSSRMVSGSGYVNFLSLFNHALGADSRAQLLGS